MGDSASVCICACVRACINFALIVAPHSKQIILLAARNPNKTKQITNPNSNELESPITIGN